MVTRKVAARATLSSSVYCSEFRDTLQPIYLIMTHNNVAAEQTVHRYDSL